MNNLLEAYASNPRYAEGGLEAAIDREEISLAKKKDAQAASAAKLEDITKPADAPVFQSPEVESPDKSMLDMHEKILSVVDTATGSFRDITGGMRKATENTLGLVVGRDNMDKGNNWVRENLPGLAEFTDQFEKGLSPRNTVSQVTQDMAQFMAPFGLYMKGIGALSAASKIEMGAITQTALADAITSGSALDPHVERFSSLVKSMGIDNNIIGWLADNEDETESEGRLKNIIDNAGVGAALVLPFMTAAMTIKGVMRLKNVARKPSPAIKPISKQDNKPKMPAPKETAEKTTGAAISPEKSTPAPKKSAEPSPDKEIEDKMDAIINELKSL